MAGSKGATEAARIAAGRPSGTAGTPGASIPGAGPIPPTARRTAPIPPAAAPALLALARALGRDAARRHGGRRAHSVPEAALLLLLVAAILAAVLALGLR